MKKYSKEGYGSYLFHEGTYFQSYQMLGAHLVEEEMKKGVRFTVWGPNAKEIKVVGDFNRWKGKKHAMKRIEDSSLWTLFIEGLEKGDLYKYEVHTDEGEMILKSDPYGFYAELRPNTASVVYPLEGYNWGDAVWQRDKSKKNHLKHPMIIYEVHLGSWKRKENGDFYSYTEIADELAEYVCDMGYTHVEFMPVMEHPFDGSWGYQTVGYYAVTSRYGAPHDFMYLVDRLHQKGIGVILDWVPGHFCKDQHGLIQFDGKCLYEYEDFKTANNKDWGTLNFDLGKPEVQSFLISNALFWLDIYHIDGLRVDAVANMLYLDYGKNQGEWSPNFYGGRENLEAVEFIKKLNKTVFAYFPNALMMAEESTQWPLVTAPPYIGGLGFNYKWNMGWMNDTLRYMEMDPIHRKWHHHALTFSLVYAFSENFLLPLSHDEVVHGKKSLINKIPGDYWQKFAALRCYYGYMMGHPGKKLMFMGAEFGQFIEWDFRKSLDWVLLNYDMHNKLKYYVKDLLKFYRKEKSLWQQDHTIEGFQWIDPHDYSQSVITFMRKTKESFIIILCNFTPIPRCNYRIGVPVGGVYKEVFNSDLEIYGGSGVINKEVLRSDNKKWHNQAYSLEVEVPPLATVFIKLLKEDIKERNSEIGRESTYR
ncbi:1,4-alpha-glucan branching protein GlgB [Clostridium formicaceticum]|uniref:1,4-alpha-glucan branching enzyme GlgB n=1 Tax=Clostridium formicaceticum TaxID=1497 RepID=A0AAC9RLH3_9CLOT|nr:1,4-alpha-glucan branching protein GlgB [Clostridium formicaceticum]AOY74895.1 1,4-alpha-glucan branching enzyme [Clostridium formicaceticum]ARE89299.1 1,4-alpha-glucan branching enzyme GlgB [Clostridium formicaceticum]